MLGRRIAFLRRERNLSQDALYLEAGISRVTIFRIEGGHVNPQVLTLKKIARALDIDIAQFFSFDCP